MTMPSIARAQAPGNLFGAAFSLSVIGLTAFLTVVDLFATQAILPALARHYDVTPAAMGIAVNASTLGMAVSGLLVAIFSARIDRRRGIVASLFLLAVPTALLAHAPNLATFAALRVCQGLLMSAAFTLTLAYLGERCTAAASAGAFAAYVTGNVASNLVGRIIAANAVQAYGLAWNFYLFAGLNILGGLLVMATIHRYRNMPAHGASAGSGLGVLKSHLSNPGLRVGFAIGFCILFAFIGTFTYVNFVLVRPPITLAMMSLGLVYFVFAPSILTTPLAGGMVAALGARTTMWIGLASALAGLPLLLLDSVFAILAGMVIVACGTFLAQATATGFVSRAATEDRGSASGLYLASYFLGGLVGSAVCGVLFDTWGWAACVAGIAMALFAGIVLANFLLLPSEKREVEKLRLA